MSKKSPIPQKLCLVILMRDFKYSVYSTVKKKDGGGKNLDLAWTFGSAAVSLWQRNECLQIPVPVWSVTLFNSKLKAISFFYFFLVLSLLSLPF